MAGRGLLVRLCSKALSGTRTIKNYSLPFFVQDLKHLPEYEAFKNPPEWKHVESLLFPKTVPKPVEKIEYPSGWRPQRAECKNHPYYVGRTGNHMLSLYLVITKRGASKYTKITRVEGDIWALENELKTYLMNKHQRIIATRVHEFCGKIEVKGDYYLDVQDFLYSKGF